MTRNRNKQQDDAPFNARDELAKIRGVRKKKKRYSPSGLDRYRAELVQLHTEGASLADMQLWLRRERRKIVARSTICRYLNKLPELRKRKE